MPYFVVQSENTGEPDSDKEAVFLDRLPPWRDRDLESPEATRCADLVLLRLEHEGRSHRQIAEAIMAVGSQRTKRPEIREAAAEIRSFLEGQGFTDDQVDEVVAVLRKLVPPGTRPETGRSAVAARLRRMKAEFAAHGFELGPIP